MYFDKWENEVAKNVQEPSNAAYDQAADPPQQKYEPNTGRAIPGEYIS